MTTRSIHQFIDIWKETYIRLTEEQLSVIVEKLAPALQCSPPTFRHRSHTVKEWLLLYCCKKT